MEYEFTLKFKLNKIDGTADDVIERLGEIDCTDALIELGLSGFIEFEFVREGTSAEEAILSALSDIKKAAPNAILVEASPDFVGLTDVADLIGVSRQNMRKLMMTHHEIFPFPVHGGNSSVWHLSQVLQFMNERKYKFPQSVFEVSRAAMQVNIAKDKSLLDLEVVKKVEQRLFA